MRNRLTRWHTHGDPAADILALTTGAVCIFAIAAWILGL